MISPFFLDANIAMYSVGGEHPLRDPCRKVFEVIAAGKLTVVTDTEVLQEILYRYISIGKRKEAFALARNLIEICRSVFPVTLDDAEFAMRLIEQNREVNVRDAIHAATMVHNRIDKILSTDRHFDHFANITRIDPETLPQVIPQFHLPIT